MLDQSGGVIVTTDERPRESFDDPGRGDATWFTLVSGDLTPTKGMSAGVAELPPNGPGLMPHRHEEAEIYYVVAGTGALTIAGVTKTVSAGATVFIPGNAEHGIRNVGDDLLRFFYVFPTDRFSDVVYRFSPVDGPVPPESPMQD